MYVAAVFSFLMLFMGLPFIGYAADFCDRPKIIQAIEMVPNSQRVKSFPEIESDPVRFPVAKDLLRIFKKVERSVLGQNIMMIENFPFPVPGVALSQEGRRISFNYLTYESIRKKVTKKEIGMAFMVAHEMGHLVQMVSFDSTQLSPNGLKNAGPKNPEAYNTLHSETECITLEILHRAGYPLTNDILSTLEIIKAECLETQDPKVCLPGHEMRTQAIKVYRQKILNTK